MPYLVRPSFLLRRPPGLCMHLLRRLILHAKVATCRFCKFSWISVAIMHLASSFCTRYVCVICGSTSQSPFRVFRSPTSATNTADVVFSSTYISSVEKIKPDYNVAIPAWHEWIFITLFQVHITMYYLTILCVISETIHAGTSGPACQSYLHLDTASKPGTLYLKEVTASPGYRGSVTVTVSGNLNAKTIRTTMFI